MSDSDGAAVVSTAYGPVHGIAAGGVRQFLGIPYAAPPVGDLRWRPPQPPEAWTETRDASEFGPVCAQDSSRFPGFGYASDTEDCLYLNVTAPDDIAPGESLPVMVWIPGGGLFIGGSNDYDPSALVTGGRVVFVSFNYRVNVFGFFSHPAINAEDHAAGNYGFQDQQAALRWVRDNIAEFGGDPDNVTIFGESAGGASVVVHLASPGSAGLFHRAILESCSIIAVAATPPMAAFEDNAIALATAAGCDDQSADSLRAIPAADLLAANAMPDGEFGPGRFNAWPMVDGVTIPHSLDTLFAAGDVNRVPVINGVNHDEFAWFMAMIELTTGASVPAEAYPHAIGPTLDVAAQSGVLSAVIPPEKVPDILERYPVDDYPAPARALAAIVGDAGLISGGGRRTTRLLAQHLPDVWFYEFDVPDSPVAWPEVSFPYGSAHVQEVQYLFPMFAGGSGTARPLNEPQQRLADQMVRYWTNFARTGDPNGDGLPTWPAYDADHDTFLQLQAPVPVASEDFGARHHCDFWDDLA